MTCDLENDVAGCIKVRRERLPDRCMNCKPGRMNEEKFRHIKKPPRASRPVGAGKVEWDRLGKPERERRPMRVVAKEAPRRRTSLSFTFGLGGINKF